MNSKERNIPCETISTNDIYYIFTRSVRCDETSRRIIHILTTNSPLPLPLLLTEPG